MLTVGLDLGRETACLPGVTKCCIAVTGGGVGIGQVDEQAGAGSDKVIREMGEGGGELVDRLWCAGAGEGVAVPAVEVGVAEEQERQCGVDGICRE